MALIKTKGYKFFKLPAYPDVPYNEYRSRIEKGQRLMGENGIDCLVLWERQNIRYYFGFQSTHWLMLSLQSAVGLIPVKGEPVLIVPDFFIGTAEQLCWVRDILGQENPHQPKSQRELPFEVAGIIKKMGCGNKHVALEMGPLGCMCIPRPLNDIEAFKAALPEAKFVNGDKVIWGCRMIKSPLEVDRIRTSVNANAAVASALVEEFRPGMTELDLSRIAQCRAASLGLSHLGDSIGLQGSFRAALNKEPMADIGVHEGATIGKGDYIFFDMFYCYKGYMPDNARMFQVGPITDEIKKMYELIWKCEDVAENMLKPGVKAREVWETMYAPVKEAGLPVLDMGGHGTGLDSHEPPSIDAWNDIEIDVGMVLSIEPWSYHSLKMHGGSGKFGIQDQFVITADGCEKIDCLRRDIIQVSHPIL